MITTTNPTPARYSVAQIAARAGVSPQAICKRMAGIDPDAYLDVAHAAKPVPAWYLS